MAEDRSSGNRSGQGSSSGKRERLDNPRTGSQYTRRDDEGKFKEVEDVGRAAAGDQRRDAENESRPGQGDRGDRREPGSGGDAQRGSQPRANDADDEE